MNTYTEINVLMEQLTAAWGSVAISCEKGKCAVSDGIGREFEAPTLLMALRMAAARERARDGRVTE